MEPRLARLFNRLFQSRSPFLRRRALAKLRHLPRDRVERRLFDALRDKQSVVRFRAAWALCELDSDRPVEPIVTALRRQRGDAARGLYEPPDAQELFDLHLHGCECRDLHRLELLTEALVDQEQDHMVRAGAALVLGFLVPKDPKALQALKAASRGQDRSMRFLARAALLRFHTRVR